MTYLIRRYKEDEGTFWQIGHYSPDHDWYEVQDNIASLDEAILLCERLNHIGF